MFVSVSASEEVEVKASANEVWNFYKSVGMAQLMLEIFPDLLEKYEVEGDGGVGTVFDFTYRPGTFSFSHHREKLTVIDNEKRIKVVETIEAGQLAFGIDRYQVRFEIIEKQNSEGEKEADSCITRGTIEYEAQDFEAAKNGIDTLRSGAFVMKAIADRMSKTSTPNTC